MVRWFGGSGTEQVTLLDISAVRPNPGQPRKNFADDKIRELSESIKEMGIIQPLIVRKTADGYELIAGERRLRSAALAGLAKVPVLIKSYNDREVAQASLIENIQREDLNPIEEATAYDRLLDEFSLTQEELAQRLGKSQSTIANKRRLLKLPVEVRHMLGSGQLNERQARTLLRLDDSSLQIFVAERVADEDLNVRQTEEVVDALLAEQAEQKVIRPVRKMYIKDVRIFLNTIRDAIGVMKKSGFQTKVIEKEDESHYEFVVRIKKRDQA